MESKYTPGPWEVKKGPWAGTVGIYAKEEFLAGIDLLGLNREVEGKANADLISAAPDLIEAMKEYVAVIVGPFSKDTFETLPSILKKMEKAIAKAEGRSI